MTGLEKAAALTGKAELCMRAAERTEGAMKALWTCHAASLALLAYAETAGFGGGDGKAREGR